MIYAVFTGLCQVIFRLIYRFRTQGRENLTQYKTNGRKFVVCANHQFLFDPVYIVMAYGVGKKMIIMAKAEIFKNPVLAFLFKSCGAFPVERGKGDHGVIDYATENVRNGHGLLIFPEGTRGDYDEMAKLKSGAFVVAGATGADIVPIRIIYPDGGNRPKLFGRVLVKIGKPIPAEELNLTGGSKAALRRAKVTYTERMDTLLDEYCKNSGYVPTKRSIDVGKIADIPQDEKTESADTATEEPHTQTVNG